MKAPIVIPRPVFLLTDVLFLAIGVGIAVAGSPALTAYIFPETVYGILVAIAAAVAFTGCVLSKDVVEMVGALALFCLLALFVVAAISLTTLSLSHAVFSLLVIEASLLKAGRGFSLLFAQIRKWVSHV
jgi:hypothetical protein